MSLHHPSLVSASDFFEEGSYIFFIMEYCPGGELFQLIVNRGALPFPQIQKLFEQIVDGVRYLHSQNIAHRDLKPENILLDNDGNAKIADFGFAHLSTPNALLTTPCGSLFYAAPEIILGLPYDGKRADIWSLGVILFCMAVGALPWNSEEKSGIVRQIMERRILMPSGMAKEIEELILKMMEIEPRERPTIEEIAQCDWLGRGNMKKMEKGLVGSQTYIPTTVRTWNVPKIVQPPVSLRASRQTGPIAKKPIAIRGVQRK
jgi:serine/threonine protein kinase